ncbi:hdc homolog, cell cycle regulator isoform X2 [Lycorma delicatula]|uniref:hdc homolog, cell cycle regulator isoform X2 n=1 Tax=Lycorma delicatula TaxID=130591 RepID=UPI003F50ED07
MAPRRNQQEGLVGAMDPEAIENHDASVTRCCVPGVECLRGDAPIPLEDLRDVVKVTCNNDHCSAGRYMHRECFDEWEQTVLTYLKSCGRARSWSERQRHQNLWTKKGYDLAFKACGCRCGKGHLKKDLDWVPPPPGFGPKEDDSAKKKKRRNKQNNRPSLAVSAHHNSELRARTGSLSSSNGSSSPPASASSVSPVHSGSAPVSGKKKSKFEFFSDRHNSGNGIFSRRQDFSSFNSLPRHKLNSYHIKMEDEGNHGNDDTRCFILSTLAANHTSRVACILCHAPMLVYDRYPLIDGTFFLSPRQHSKSCIETKVEGRTQFLSAVCMGCLEAWAPGRRLRCRYCNTPWDGSSLVLGTMYSYDIFAAMPCCTERLKCNSCQKPLLMPHQRLNFFSDYSHRVACPHCTAQDFHFVKPLPFCYAREWP